MNEQVYIFHDKKLRYPKRDRLNQISIEQYSPSIRYPEYRFLSISEQENKVYDSIREIFRELGFDTENYGKAEWNPLGKMIPKGSTVLVKPNLVKHINEISENGVECLYTNPSLVRAIVDYIIIALDGSGRIIIADAPVQSCEFEEFYETSGYKQVIDFYKSQKVEIEFYDLREVVAIVENGIVIQRENPRGSYKSTCINLGKQSNFCGLDSSEIKKLRITDYSPRVMKMHHNINKHEYSISNALLESDVIVNIPKIKTHRKAGMTASMKNSVGINANKDYLPHHRMGDVKSGGDQYEKDVLLTKLDNYFKDNENIALKERKMNNATIFHFMARITSKLLRIFFKNRVIEGNWNKNDTIWRMVNDLNKIVLFADKTGKIQNNPQRKMLIVGDMIIAGEGEGPLMPIPVECNCIICGDNPILFDMVVAKLMGYDINEISVINKSPLYCEKFEKYSVFSNDDEFNGLMVKDLKCIHNFKRPKGWEKRDIWAN